MSNLKKIIYTIGLNGYDEILSPMLQTGGWEYIAIVDDTCFVGDGWDVIKVAQGGIRESRIYKIDPWRFFPDFETIIYVDGNIQPNCDLDKLVSDYHKGGITIRKHPKRNCIYDEAETVLEMGKSDPEIVRGQVEKYRQEGYPEQHGLVAAGVNIRSNTMDVKRLCSLWLNEVLNYSHRDQLSFNYASWKSGVPYDLMPPDILETQFIIRRHYYKRKQQGGV